MADGKNGQQIGAENALRVQLYLEGLEREGHGLPERNGKPMMSAIALAAGVDRQVLYKNKIVKSALEMAAERLGLEVYLDRGPQIIDHDQRDQRILKLEQENASLAAENLDLRKRVARLEHIEHHMTETGRRTYR